MAVARRMSTKDVRKFLEVLALTSWPKTVRQCVSHLQTFPLSA